jgi:hypothetical protein
VPPPPPRVAGHTVTACGSRIGFLDGGNQRRRGPCRMRAVAGQGAPQAALVGALHFPILLKGVQQILCPQFE